MKDEFNNETTYLGDGVYACLENGMLRLTSGSHRLVEANDKIYLEREEFKALLNFAKRIGWVE